MIRGRSNAPLSSLTRLEAERESKLRAGEEAERIETLGQDSDEKAIPWVQKEYNARVKAEELRRDLELEQLQKLLKNKHFKDYFRFLAQLLINFTQDEDISSKYAIDIDITDQGIVAKIRGTNYVGAFKPSVLASYDHFYCHILAMKISNTVAKLEGYIRKSAGGVALPDSEDLKTYG